MSQAYVGKGLRKFTRRSLRKHIVDNYGRGEHNIAGWAPILIRHGRRRGINGPKVRQFDALDLAKAYEAALQNNYEVPCATGIAEILAQMLPPNAASAIIRNLTGERKTYNRARDFSDKLATYLYNTLTSYPYNNRNMKMCKAAKTIVKVLQRARG